MFQRDQGLGQGQPDQPVVTVALTGEGVAPPVIAVSADSLGASLFSGQTSVQTMTIANTGAHHLDFVIHGRGDGRLEKRRAQLLAVARVGIDHDDNELLRHVFLGSPMKAGFSCCWRRGRPPKEAAAPRSLPQYIF